VDIEGHLDRSVPDKPLAVRFADPKYALSAVLGPHRFSIRSRVDTTRPAREIRQARIVRSFDPAIGNGSPPFSKTSSGPRTRKRMAAG
jgi:hypothetical protein